MELRRELKNRDRQISSLQMRMDQSTLSATHSPRSARTSSNNNVSTKETQTSELPLEQTCLNSCQFEASQMLLQKSCLGNTGSQRLSPKGPTNYWSPWRRKLPSSHSIQSVEPIPDMKAVASNCVFENSDSGSFGFNNKISQEPSDESQILQQFVEPKSSQDIHSILGLTQSNENRLLEEIMEVVRRRPGDLTETCKPNREDAAYRSNLENTADATGQNMDQQLLVSPKKEDELTVLPSEAPPCDEEFLIYIESFEKRIRSLITAHATRQID